VAGFRGRVEDGTVSMFSTTSATIPHVHHLLNPRLTTHLNISNNLCSTWSFYPSDCVLVVTRLGGGGRGEEDPVVNILLNFFFVLLIKRETNFFFVLLIKREACPHHTHLPFHKMRGMHSYRASPFKLVPPHLLSLVFTSF
jgi:hypothetical protein